MHTRLKIPAVFACTLFILILSGCPDTKKDEVPDVNFNVGIWAGSVVTEARLVLRNEPEYWCAAWKIEVVDLRIEEFQDGSLSGTAKGNFFHWAVNDPYILEYDKIAVGHWNQYSTFELQITGEVTDDGYTIEVAELPVSLPDPADPGKYIDFWDFLYPSRLEGEWPDDGSHRIKGSSNRAQGEDYRETSTQSNFREFDVTYTWDIGKL